MKASDPTATIAPISFIGMRSSAAAPPAVVAAVVSHVSTVSLLLSCLPLPAGRHMSVIDRRTMFHMLECINGRPPWPASRPWPSTRMHRPAQAKHRCPKTVHAHGHVPGWHGRAGNPHRMLFDKAQFLELAGQLRIRRFHEHRAILEQQHWDVLLPADLLGPARPRPPRIRCHGGCRPHGTGPAPAWRDGNHRTIPHRRIRLSMP